MSFGNWNHDFKVGDAVHFIDRAGLYVFGEIVGIHGPWLWVDDGGGLHTVHYDEAAYDSEYLPLHKAMERW